MSAVADILAFLREPDTFAAGAQDPKRWLSALEDIVLPEIAARGDRAMRVAQVNAWKGLANERVGLVLGPPGTGKTFLLSKMVNGYMRALRASGPPARAFLTAFTRNAIGNLLEGVARDQHHAPVAEQARIVFLGNPPAGLKNIEVLPANNDSFEDILNALATGPIVLGATVWALNRLVRACATADRDTARLFDLICIDEASQMVVSNGLMALAGIAEGGRVVIAGDDQQLPPVRSVRDTELDGRQLGGSLYAFLKSAKVKEFALDETFRLNTPLTQFSEQKFYPGRFTSRVAAGADRLKLRQGWEEGLSGLSLAALDPRLPVVIAIHDRGGASTSNAFEAEIASQLASQLADRMEDAETDFWSDKLAIISPHRAQNALIRRSLPQAIRTGAFVETVDRIQGKERDAVILSYCVSDAEFAAAEGGFIFSAERLNVATTRARFKLIVLISRNLLDTLSVDQDVVDKTEVLREFVYNASKRQGDLQLPASDGKLVRVEILTRGFEDENAEVDLTPAKSEAPARIELTPALEDTLRAIKAATEGAYPTAKMWALEQRLRRDPFQDCVALHHLGLINLEHRLDANRADDAWQARALPVARQVRSVTSEDVAEQVIVAIKRATTDFYSGVRATFGWMNSAGEDLLWPHVNQLRKGGRIEVQGERDGRRLKLPQGATTEAKGSFREDPPLEIADYLILNGLEDIEAARINFGVTEAWTSTTELSRKVMLDSAATIASVARLQGAGHLMIAEEGRVRSRMAEVAREIKLVKQRFRYNDADQRPYLVRNLKVEVSDRNKPQRNQSMREAVADLKDALPGPYGDAVEDVARAFSVLWNTPDPQLAAFQVRGLRAGLAAWAGQGPDTIAIAANTGSGKTEAALLPLIAGALAERRSGLQGTKVILAYPRIRLVTNQAQRLVHYLAACATTIGEPPLTVGLQTGQVPQSLAGPNAKPDPETWRQEASGIFVFPFFDCPQSGCGAPLHLKVEAGSRGADRLSCTQCAWSFDGWVGSKNALASNPPDFFLPTSDSLHQWLHNPRYGALWGDRAPYTSPRAFVADEIHLYTHIHGAQVGMAFQRLLGRCQVNDAEGRRPVAIGMSATVSDPARAWERLIGRENAVLVQSEAHEVDPNPKGREYFYFVQPEIESRNKDIAGASTTIQSLMCLAHGMRRRTGSDGGYRALVFFDSIDKMRRLHSAFQDAEGNQRLARYRTSVFDDDPDGTPRAECCGNPTACDRFDDGECWWFAAKDKNQWGAKGYREVGDPLVVADRPVFSGTTGKAEELIKRSDVIFTTSSLEVGYDDPDITLVYQHYSPANLASFVQRKGRGGRGSDDRPITAVTLSMYSPRDRWWFRNPRGMISPAGFEAPLNRDNFFVQRGQVLTALLDGIARLAFRLRQDADLDPDALKLTLAGNYAEKVFGPDIWKNLSVADAKSLWRAAKAAQGADRPPSTLPDLRQSFVWCPDFLHDTINLPSVTVGGNNMVEAPKQDVSLILPTIAPGNASRRFDGRYVHWRPVIDGQAPWLRAEDYEHAAFEPLVSDSANILDLLPLEARGQLMNPHPLLCRPTQVFLEALGQVNGSSWTGHFACPPNAPPLVRPCEAGDVETISYDSRGELRGALLISAQADKARALPTSGSLMSKASVFAGEGVTVSDAGLLAAQVYWGADAELRFNSPTQPSDPVGLSQIFVHPKDQRPLLHGYSLETEGVQMAISTVALDAYVETIVAQLEQDQALKKWLSGQYLRYTLESGARALGVNAYQARRGADLFVSANGDTDLAQQLRQLLMFWDSKKLAALFESTRTRRLAHHPMYTKARVERTAEALANQSVQALLKSAIANLRDATAQRTYLRSAILHGLTLRLKQAVALVGQGDDNRLLAHVRLPLQYPGAPEDIITICEAGQKGDGTIRTVATQWQGVLALWTNGFVSDCPNAAEDAIQRDFWRSDVRARHGAWRSQDRTDRFALSRILAELTPKRIGEALPARLARVLFDYEEFGGQQFAIYDLATECEAVRTDLAARIGRAPLDWELVSATVDEAKSGATPELARLLKAYNALGNDEDEDDAETRLAEQVYRLSAPLCFDGCRACVHQSSDLMSDSLVESSVSRHLLEGFMASWG